MVVAPNTNVVRKGVVIRSTTNLGRGYKSTKNPKGGYWKPSIVTQGTFDHRNGYYVKPNKVAFKSLDFKKNVDLDAHVIMFNSVVKANVIFFEKYVINVFSYTLKNMTSYWCHN
jgi:hypothetical protein